MPAGIRKPIPLFAYEYWMRGGDIRCNRQFGVQRSGIGSPEVRICDYWLALMN